MRAPGRERHTRGWRATPHSAREQVRHALLVNFQHGHLDRLVLRQQLTAGGDALEEARSHARDQALAMILRRADQCRELQSAPRTGSPIWSALRISFGRSMDSVNNTADGYLFSETPLTWEANPKLAVNVSPKVAWAGVGTLWGVGIGANIKVAPRWELLPEANIVLNSELSTFSPIF